jgi:hypothetical protein
MPIRTVDRRLVAHAHGSKVKCYSAECKNLTVDSGRETTRTKVVSAKNIPSSCWENRLQRGARRMKEGNAFVTLQILGEHSRASLKKLENFLGLFGVRRTRICITATSHRAELKELGDLML